MRRQRRQFTADRIVCQPLADELVAPGNDMGARHVAELFGLVHTGKGLKIMARRSASATASRAE
jgi:hypothetical protein